MANARTKTRTAEEIRDAVRAELPVMRAVARRLRALGREMRETPENKRWNVLFDTPGEDTDEFHELSVYTAVVGTLTDKSAEGVSYLEDLARQLADETDPKRWREAKARAPKERARVAALEAERRAKIAEPLPPRPRLIPDELWKMVLEVLHTSVRALGLEEGPAREKTAVAVGAFIAILETKNAPPMATA